MTPLPQGFLAHAGNIGIKDASPDFVVIASETPATAAAVFTKSRFAGPSVLLSRASVSTGRLRAFAVISKNANVANGPDGHADAVEVATTVANVIGVQPSEVLLASTGVIGRRYPIERVRRYLARLHWPFATNDAEACATAIMTTDTKPKLAWAWVGKARVVGIAKGIGMIEPDMATLITLFVTDASVPNPELDTIFRRVIDTTFNAVSIDSDMSTSDTAAIMANGAAGPVDPARFESALYDVALDLTKMIARDGEGATKLLEVLVDSARDAAQARRVAKVIVNSPLVKTAIHGADPNWGRVAAAIGQCTDDVAIDPERVVIRFGTQEVYPQRLDTEDLKVLSRYMQGEDVLIHVSLGLASGSFTAYGCDLTADYVRINADYTS